MDIEAFRKELEKRRRELLERRGSRDEAAKAVELDQSKVGRVSRMDAMQQQAMSKATRERAEQELRQIETALSRIAAGEYGDCVACGGEIGEGRLRIAPAAQVCVSCASARERN